MSALRFDERVAIVTGAGNGLGRSHALLLASLGAKVVVNDLGGGAHGDGKSSSAADKVVAEIIAAGGQAVANYDSVENGQAIVQTALDAFGTVDIVINNAGILRDVSFAKMSQADWDLILKVHLTGSMSVSHAAWPIMREKGYGRIIMTTSAAGIYGNFGQANYCAAKLGLAGLANCLAEEGRSKNIHVNTIAPLAASRLTETIMPPDLLAMLKPEAVSPLVAWLCHEDCSETKGLFEVGAGYIAKLRWERTEGYQFNGLKPFSVDDVARRWSSITDFSHSTHPTSTTESFMPIMEKANHPSLGGNEFIDLDAAAKAEVVLESSYDERDLALYALGVGAARDPLDSSELKLVYELGEFYALPTYAAMPQMNAMLSAAKAGTLQLPGSNFGFDRLLHGEQYTEIYQVLPPSAKLTHSFKLKTAYDKAPHAVVTYGISSRNEQGELVAYNEMTAFVRGAGGWGGDRGPSTDINVPPAREPDAIITEKTDAHQTLLYRLSGDWNPLHADPAFAKAFGFDRPILHGMCTHGYCGRHVIKAFCHNDPRLVKSIKVRFAKSVFPGETLETRMWKESDTRIIFETKVLERDEVVIKNAAIELYKEVLVKKKPSTATTQPSATPAVQAAPVEDKIIPADIFQVVNQHIGQHPELAAKVKTVFQFNLSNPASQWVIDLKNAQGSAYQGADAKADVTIDLDESLIETVVTASLADVQKLYFAGKIKIGGNIMASNKLTVLQAIDAKGYQQAKAQRLGSSAASPQVAAVTPADSPIIPADIFQVVNQHIGQHPELAAKVKTVFQFNLSNPASQWVIDLKNAQGSAYQGADAKADVTIDLDESLIETVVTASLADVQKLYFAGKIKIGGNIMASNKLTVLQAIDAKGYQQAKAQRLASGQTTTTVATASPIVSKTAQAPTLFAQLSSRLASKGIHRPAIYQFKLTEPNDVWVVDLSQQPTQVYQGEAAKATSTFILSDDDLVNLMQQPQQLSRLYQQGKVRIDGDVKAAQQLDFLA